MVHVVLCALALVDLVLCGWKAYVRLVETATQRYAVNRHFIYAMRETERMVLAKQRVDERSLLTKKNGWFEEFSVLFATGLSICSHQHPLQGRWWRHKQTEAA